VKILFLAIVLLAGGGYTVYYAVDWYAALPTGWLLLRQDDGLHPATTELFRRYQQGDLSDTQKQRLFTRALEVVPLLELRRDPYPAGIPLSVKARYRLRMPKPACDYGWHVFEDSWIIRVDGAPVAESAESPALGPFAPGSTGFALSQTVPPMPPGAHEITVSASLSLRPISQVYRVDAPGIHTWNVSASARIVVENRPPSEYVRAVSTPVLTEQIEQAVNIDATPSLSRSEEPTVTVKYAGIPISIYGELLARPAGSGPFHALGPFVAFKDAGWGAEQTVSLASMPGAKDATHVDLRIEPSATIAVQYWHDEYYGEVIERFGIPVARRGGSRDER